MDLSQCLLFRGIPDKELKRAVADMSEVNQPAGRQVAVRGEGGVGFMVILEGEVEVTTADGRKHRLVAGDHFGEMALLDKQGRSADVVALTPLKLAAVPEWSFKTFLTAHPEVSYRMLQVMSQRLREAESH